LPKFKPVDKHLKENKALKNLKKDSEQESLIVLLFLEVEFIG
jgi:hypothetical protein